MQLSRSVGAPSRGEHVGTIAIAGELAVGEFTPVSVVVVVVNVRRLGMTGGVTLSVTQRSKWIFLFFRFK